MQSELPQLRIHGQHDEPGRMLPAHEPPCATSNFSRPSLVRPCIQIFHNGVAASSRDNPDNFLIAVIHLLVLGKGGNQCEIARAKIFSICPSIRHDGAMALGGINNGVWWTKAFINISQSAHGDGPRACCSEKSQAKFSPSSSRMRHIHTFFAVVMDSRCRARFRYHYWCMIRL